MVDSEILEYVKTQLKAGFTAEQIRRALLDADYTVEEVNEAIETAQQDIQPTPAAAPAQPPPLKEGGGKAGFALSILGGILILASVVLTFLGNTLLSDMFSSVPVLGKSNLDLAGNDLIILNVILAIGILLGAIFSRKKSEIKMIAGVVVILLSSISLLNGSGFFLAIISLIGGLLLLAGK